MPRGQVFVRGWRCFQLIVEESFRGQSSPALCGREVSVTCSHTLTASPHCGGECRQLARKGSRDQPPLAHRVGPSLTCGLPRARSANLDPTILTKRARGVLSRPALGLVDLAHLAPGLRRTWASSLPILVLDPVTCINHLPAFIATRCRSIPLLPVVNHRWVYPHVAIQVSSTRLTSPLPVGACGGTSRQQACGG